MQQGRFRSDLYHRLNVVKLCLPPLRNRTDDLSSLVLAFAHRHSSLYEPIESIEPELLSFLACNPFLGNVRELENAVQRMLFLKLQGHSLGLADWIAQAGPETSGPETSGPEHDPIGEAANAAWKAILQNGLPCARVIQEIEKRVLETAIKIDGCTRRQIAKRLHTSERTLYYKMRAHGINTPAA